MLVQFCKHGNMWIIPGKYEEAHQLSEYIFRHNYVELVRRDAALLIAIVLRTGLLTMTSRVITQFTGESISSLVSEVDCRFNGFMIHGQCRWVVTIPSCHICGFLTYPCTVVLIGIAQ